MEGKFRLGGPKTAKIPQRDWGAPSGVGGVEALFCGWGFKDLAKKTLVREPAPLPGAAAASPGLESVSKLRPPSPPNLISPVVAQRSHSVQDPQRWALATDPPSAPV